jgi:RNA polymerase sigma factor (sigma-70 family)
MTDTELLAMHRQGDESAFPNLVRRHLGWVCGLARRRLRDTQTAEDVAQAVFVLLHRKAPVFTTDGAMIAWLHKAARYAAETAARAQRRRKKHETEAAQMHPLTTEDSDVNWQELAPVLDELVDRLSQSDREAILLRYYRDLSFAEVAEQIGTTPDAARKRVERAIEKLRDLAEWKGVTASAATTLPAFLAQHVRVIPPPGLVTTATVSATAKAGSALSLTIAQIVNGGIVAMSGTKLAVVAILAAALLIAGGVTVVTVWLVSSDSPPAATATPQPSPKPPQPRPTLAVVNFPNPRIPRKINFSIWAPSPFQAIRWPDATPQVLVNGTWYQLQSVNHIPVDRIIRFMVPHGYEPICCFQVEFEKGMLNYVDQLGGQAGDFTKATLEVKDLTTGQPRTLPDVPATMVNCVALQTAREKEIFNDQNTPKQTLLSVIIALVTGQKEIFNIWDTPKRTLLRAITAIGRNDTTTLFNCFDSLNAAQRHSLSYSLPAGQPGNRQAIQS